MIPTGIFLTIGEAEIMTFHPDFVLSSAHIAGGQILSGYSSQRLSEMFYVRVNRVPLNSVFG